MLLNNLTKKEIKEISAEIAPKLISHPAFMFYCKNGSNRQKFIEDFFCYFLSKWSEKELIFTNETHDVILTLVDINEFHTKDKGIAAKKLKRYKNQYANVQYHQGNIFYLAEIVAPAYINTKIMTVYATLKNASIIDEMVKEAIKMSKEQDFMIVYETFSKKSNEIMAKLGFEKAYEKQFQGTQYFETIMTYYENDMSKPAKLIEDFKPIVINDEPEESEEAAKKQ